MKYKNNENDIVKHLFDDKYSEKVKKDVLAKLQNNRSLPEYIKKHHPKYISNGDAVMVFTLAKDLGWI